MTMLPVWHFITLNMQKLLAHQGYSTVTTLKQLRSLTEILHQPLEYRLCFACTCIFGRWEVVSDQRCRELAYAMLTVDTYLLHI